MKFCGREFKTQDWVVVADVLAKLFAIAGLVLVILGIVFSVHHGRTLQSYRILEPETPCKQGCSTDCPYTKKYAWVPTPIAQNVSATPVPSDHSTGYKDWYVGLPDGGRLLFDNPTDYFFGYLIAFSLLKCVFTLYLEWWPKKKNQETQQEERNWLVLSYAVLIFLCDYLMSSALDNCHNTLEVTPMDFDYGSYTLCYYYYDPNVGGDCYNKYTCPYSRSNDVDDNVVWIAEDSNPAFMITMIFAPILAIPSFFKSYWDKFPNNNSNISKSSDAGGVLALYGIMVIAFFIADIVVSGGLAWKFDLSFSIGDLKIVPSVISVQAFLSFMQKGVKIYVKWKLNK